MAVLGPLAVPEINSLERDLQGAVGLVLVALPEGALEARGSVVVGPLPLMHGGIDGDRLVGPNLRLAGLGAVHVEVAQRKVQDLLVLPVLPLDVKADGGVRIVGERSGETDVGAERDGRHRQRGDQPSCDEESLPHDGSLPCWTSDTTGRCYARPLPVSMVPASARPRSLARPSARLRFTFVYVQ